MFVFEFLNIFREKKETDCLKEDSNEKFSDILENAQRLFSRERKEYASLGIQQLKTEDWESAIDCFNKAIELSIEATNVQNEIGGVIARRHYLLRQLRKLESIND